MQYISGRRISQDFGVPGITTNDTVVNVDGRISVGIGTTATADIDTNQIRIRDNIIDSRGVIGSIGYFLTKDEEGLTWTNVPPLGNNSIFLAEDGDILNNIGLQTYTGLNFISDQLLGITTNPDNPGFADIRIDPRWFRDRTPGGGGGIYTTGTVGIGSTQPRLGAVGILTDVKLDVLGDAIFSGTVIADNFEGEFNVKTEDLEVSGVSTFSGEDDNILGNTNTGSVQIDGGVGIDKNVSIGASLFVNSNVGIGTSTNLDGNALTIDGGDVKILGDTNTLRIGTAVTISNGIVSATKFDGRFLDIEFLNVTGIATINSGIVTNLNVSGIATINSGIVTNLNVSGIATINSGIVTNLNVTGIATINSGIVTNLKVTGLSTFGDAARFNAGVDIFDDLFVSGNISVGGTGVTLDTETIRVEGKELLIGFTTTITPNDTTANAAGIAVASTEGWYLVDLQVPGINTTPNTYKQIKWFKTNTFVGQGTDAFISNQPLSIGNTQIGEGTILAIGNNISFSDNNLTIPTLNVTGVSTLSIVQINTGIINNLSVSDIATINSGILTNLNVTGIGTIDTGIINNLSVSDIATINSGILTNLNVTGIGTIDTGIINNLSVSDIATINSGILTNLSVSGISTLGFTTVSNLYVSGITTSDGGFIGNLTGTASTASFATTAFTLNNRVESEFNVATAATATNVIGGIGSLTSLTVSGISTLGFTTVSNLYVSGITTSDGGFIGNLTGTASTASFATTAFTLNNRVESEFNVAFAQTAGIATNLVGGVAGQISYQTASNVTGFLTTGPSNQVLTSQGPGLAPIWTAVGSASAIEGITIKDEGSIVGSGGSITNIDFIGNGVIATATAGGNIATITISQSVDGSGGIANTATNVIGGIGSLTSLTVSGISTLGFTTVSNLYVSGITTSDGGFIGNLTGTASTASFATTAFNLANAANITTGTISSDRLTGSYAIDITGNAGTASFATTAFNLDGFVESDLNVAFAQTAGLSTETTKLQTSRTFEITGDVVASPITFDGTGNVSLAATIQPNSVRLGTDTFGDYVKSITGTSNEVTVSVTSGEGSTPQIGLPNDVTIGQDLTVTRDVEINRNLNVDGNITIGGTSATLFTQTLTVADPDLILGVRTDALGNDISTDNTANHGGIAIASTEGNPLIILTNPGAGETLPSTYKKIMWFKSGSFSGLGTDAWLSNYAIGIGSTQFPTGTRLAAGNVQITENDLSVVRNINASGIVTASGGFEGNLTGTASTASFATTAFNLDGFVESDLNVATAVTATNLADAANITTGTISSDRLTGSYDIDITGTATTATNLSNAANITTGTISSDRLTGSYAIDVTGTATTATNLSDAANITTGTINSDRLTGSYGINITGNAGTASTASFATTAFNLNGVVESDLNVAFASTASFATTAFNLADAANITTGTISSDRLTGSYDIDITGTATTATNLADAANITTGTISSDRLTGSYAIDITGNAGTASTASFATTAFNLNGVVESDLNVAFAQTAGIATYTSEWTLGANGTSDFTFTGPGFTGAENDPTLYLTRGQQYKFINNSGGSHPFRIQSTPNGSTGTQYNDGITNNDTSTGTLTWNVQFDAPDILYYQCTNHSSMGGKIYIVNAGIASDVNLFTTGIATIGNVQIGAGIVTATSGVVTYYGDGQYLQNITSSGGISSITISNNTLDQSQYLTYAVSTGNTTGLGVTTEGLVFNPFTGRMGIGQTLPSAKLDINVGTGLTALNIEGSEGQLFSITNNLTSGSIFSVNDVSGIPSIDVDADGTIQLAPFGSTEYVGIGTTNPTQKLDVNGNIRLRGALYDNSNGIGNTDQVLTSTGSGISWQNAAVSGVGIQSGGTVIGTGITTLNFVGAGSTFAVNGTTVDISVSAGTTRTVSTYTATSGQTTFSATYNVGYVDVFLNGVKLSENEYTATNGTSIVLDTGASLNDIVEVVGYSNINISGGSATPDISPVMMGMIF